MNAREIVNRGVQVTEYKDNSYSYTGLQDFKEEKPEIYRTNPKGPNQRPRTSASKNNSYT